MYHILDELYNESPKISINDNSKIIIMSDCHRGAGDKYDNFLENKNLYNKALEYYYQNGFTYIELGDGDEMWEVDNYTDIINEHLETFKLLKKFHDDNRLIMLYGNHDIYKRDKDVLEHYFYTYHNQETAEDEELLNNLDIFESLILTYQNYNIFLLHGHQVDLLNGIFWRLSRFLVRNIWKKLELIGIKQPVYSTENHEIATYTDKIFDKWSRESNIMIITAHSHRPIFPKVGQSLYFNDGSCLHQSGITGIKISNGHIALVKWTYKLSDDNNATIERSIIAGNIPIIDFFKQNNFVSKPKTYKLANKNIYNN